jgi:hypothetical protein
MWIGNTKPPHSPWRPPSHAEPVSPGPPRCPRPRRTSQSEPCLPAFSAPTSATLELGTQSPRPRPRHESHRESPAPPSFRTAAAAGRRRPRHDTRTQRRGRRQHSVVRHLVCAWRRHQRRQLLDERQRLEEPSPGWFRRRVQRCRKSMLRNGGRTLGEAQAPRSSGIPSVVRPNGSCAWLFLLVASPKFGDTPCQDATTAFTMGLPQR